MISILRQTHRFLHSVAHSSTKRGCTTLAAHPRFPAPSSMQHLPEVTQEKLSVVKEKAGFTPNIFRILARRPDELDAFWNFHDILMADTKELSKAEKEMIVVATSGENRCHYCVVAHGAILRVLTKNPHLADQLANNYRKADITERQRAMLDFAIKVSRCAEEIGDEDYKALAQAGFSEEAAWDIAMVASFFAMSNRLANTVGLRANQEFYDMGRAKK
eukprot:gnl/MRDRNA2_/MRDRNA2_154580_c0_seq1.p1 gnl/MRDRNA2_/MRDRNA2_154580_c0~~gnl/MRDRNA2_/MRDRNA2_154580_c0_seq1.p1  ORF type:complete len:218 (+),score=41.18 gnl/MRDRNA2_/MRDRNA2_154580_c0_seq1:76-729(+)